ncbi:type II toxin-antitoxin system RelE/ParE family toxin [Paraburkholderia sp. BR10882]|uniref:type II toxin-antitoxin system RelE/ParE family toxin n=1 Tax=unclassified Paraburkholderia TaxID=2615204 RepID=UPI0034CF288A
MTVTVEWTATALLNLADILDYVREQSPQGADTLAAEIQARTGRIATDPKLYRVGRVRGTREAVVTENYLLVYRVARDVAQILNVLHARQQWPAHKSGTP